MALLRFVLVLTLLAVLPGCGPKPAPPPPPPSTGQVGSLTPGAPAGSSGGPYGATGGAPRPPGMEAGGLMPGGAPGTSTR